MITAYDNYLNFKREVIFRRPKRSVETLNEHLLQFSEIASRQCKQYLRETSVLFTDANNLLI